MRKFLCNIINSIKWLARQAIYTETLILLQQDGISSSVHVIHRLWKNIHRSWKEYSPLGDSGHSPDSTRIHLRTFCLERKTDTLLLLWYGTPGCLWGHFPVQHRKTCNFLNSVGASESLGFLSGLLWHWPGKNLVYFRIFYTCIKVYVSLSQLSLSWVGVGFKYIALLGYHTVIFYFVFGSVAEKDIWIVYFCVSQIFFAYQYKQI